ncbi:MAG: hypothetical protein ABI353_12810, partial [Isosphaeraceae bacterium]
PKDLWIVPKAKHNRSRDVNPAAYTERISTFLRASAPRRLVSAPERPAISSDPVKAGPASRLAAAQTVAG